MEQHEHYIITFAAVLPEKKKIPGPITIKLCPE